MTTTNTDSYEGKSAPRGARTRVYFCAAKKGKDLIVEAVEGQTKDEAIASFSETYDVAPQKILDGEGNGYYISKGTGMSNAQRISVTVTPAQLVRRTTTPISAEFGGWNVVGSGLEACSVDGRDYGPDELFAIECVDRVDPNSKVKKPKLKKREVIPLDKLDNVHHI